MNELNKHRQCTATASVCPDCGNEFNLVVRCGKYAHPESPHSHIYPTGRGHFGPPTHGHCPPTLLRMGNPFAGRQS